MPKIKDTTHKSKKRSKGKQLKSKQYAMLDEEGNIFDKFFKKRVNQLGNELFDVEYVYGKKLDPRDQEVKYLVKWAGFKKADSTWEPLHHLISVHSTVKLYDIKQSRLLFYSKLSPKLINNEISVRNAEDKKSLEANKNEKTSKDKAKTTKDEISEEEKAEENVEIVKKKQKIIGDFREHIPLAIIKHKIGKFLNEGNSGNISKVFYKVEFEADETGRKPKSAYYSIEDLKVYCPLLLIEYFEKNAVLLDNNKNFV